MPCTCIDVCSQLTINKVFLSKELHFKKIQGLENLLNFTRQDIKKASREQLTALTLEGNVTRREFHGVWTAINSTQNDLLLQMKKVTDNLTEQVNVEYLLTKQNTINHRYILNIFLKFRQFQSRYSYEIRFLCIKISVFTLPIKTKTLSLATK